MVIQLMRRADANLKKKTPSPGYMLDSSESESESGSNSSQIEMYESIVDEYLGTTEKKSAWHRLFVLVKG